MNRTSGALFATLTLLACGGDTVTTPPPLVPTTVTVTPATSALNAIGATGQLTAAVRDQNGEAIAAPVTWTSSDERVVTVTSTGLVTAVREGSVFITARAGDAEGRGTVSVATTPPTIASVSPSVWVDGQAATLSGSNFSTVVAGNVVLVDGAAATVLSASPTALTIRVPVLCQPVTRTVEVELTANGLAAEGVAHPVSPGAPLSVADGRQAVFSGGGEACLQFDPAAEAAEYLVGVQSLSDNATVMNGVRLSASVDPGATTPPQLPIAVAGGASAPGQTFDGSARDPVGDALDAHRRAEARFIADEIGLINRLVRTGPAPRVGRAAAAVPDLNVGQEVALKVRDFNGPQTCSQAGDITATVQAKTTHSIWFVDNANPANGFTQTEVQGMADNFESAIYAPAVAMFGNPSDTDGNGRVAIVITQEINKTNREEGRIQGFVSGCDFFPKSSAPDSNEGETFYLLAPDPTGIHGQEISKTLVTDIFPFVIAHELTHIIQFGIRIGANGSVPEIYHLEGQATFAEETVGHAVEGNTSGQNYGSTIAWDFDEQASTRWYRGAFSDLVWWFGGKPSDEDQSAQQPGAPEQCTWLADVDDPCTSRASFYGVTWSFLRWATDQYFAGNESTLQKALIQSDLSGFALFEAAIGHPVETMFPPWSAALYLDDRAAVDGSLTYASWNLNDIFEGGAIVPTGRLTPRLRGFEDFGDDAQVRAGSTAYWRISGTTQPRTAVKIRTATGAPLPDHMVVWVVKVPQ